MEHRQEDVTPHREGGVDLGGESGCESTISARRLWSHVGATKRAGTDEGNQVVATRRESRRTVEEGATRPSSGSSGLGAMGSRQGASTAIGRANAKVSLSLRRATHLRVDEGAMEPRLERFAGEGHPAREGHSAAPRVTLLGQQEPRPCQVGAYLEGLHINEPAAPWEVAAAARIGADAGGRRLTWRRRRWRGWSDGGGDGRGDGRGGCGGGSGGFGGGGGRRVRGEGSSTGGGGSGVGPHLGHVENRAEGPQLLVARGVVGRGGSGSGGGGRDAGRRDGGAHVERVVDEPQLQMQLARRGRELGLGFRDGGSVRQVASEDGVLVRAVMQ